MGNETCYNDRTMLCASFRAASALLAILLLLFLPTGCARSPSNNESGGAGSGPQLIITMTVAHQIRPDYFYFVLFNNAGDAHGTNGPIPVVAPPWGNGFAGG